ncbi:helix-turn-helix transcriptional regulator [Streptomyces filamentosus]|uniref:helix-turn-helix transcriptional regulator n=1 Tax=Streptomyces filamentosus TaxID=67294 RepID=UPI00380D6F68
MRTHRGDHSGWTFLTNHARVLLSIARDPEVRLRDVAAECGITERTVQGIVSDLEAAGYLTRTRAADGRRNQYRIDTASPFRHPAEAGHEIAGLLALLAPRPADTRDDLRDDVQDGIRDDAPDDSVRQP